MADIWDLARSLGAKIVFFKPDDNISKDGMYYREISTVCLNDCASRIRQENVLLHETGHSFYGHTHYKCHSKGWSSKQEKQADKYMIKQRADEWLAGYDWEPEFIDFEAFIKHFELEKHMYDLVVEVFESILGHNKLSNHFM